MTGTEAGKQEAAVFMGVSRLLFFDNNGDATTVDKSPHIRNLTFEHFLYRLALPTCPPRCGGGLHVLIIIPWYRCEGMGILQKG
jgi:hypothetical protein